MTEIRTAPQIQGDVRDAFIRFVTSLADSKRVLGIRYSDWLLGAPSIEAGIAASSMAQDEWGHARLIYAMLKDFGIDPVEIEHDRDASAYANCAALDDSLDDWVGFVCMVAIVDTGLTALLEGFADGAFESARSRVPKMISEEEFHRDLGAAWFRKLAGSDEAREQLRGYVAEMAGVTLRYVAPDDADDALLVDEGLLAPATERREKALESWQPIFEVAGIDADAVSGTDLPWDAKRRRGAGQPDQETVERARGDRNRALFVE